MTLAHTTFFSRMSYLCKALVLASAMIKNKYLRKVSVGQEMRAAVFNMTPRFEKLFSV